MLFDYWRNCSLIEWRPHIHMTLTIQVTDTKLFGIWVSGIPIPTVLQYLKASILSVRNKAIHIF